MSSALAPAAALLRRQLPLLHASASNVLTMQQAHTLAQSRQYAADADPMIVPVQKQQQQPAPSQRQETALELPDENKGPWERVIDKASGQPYWWNANTGKWMSVGWAANESR